MRVRLGEEGSSVFLFSQASISVPRLGQVLTAVNMTEL